MSQVMSIFKLFTVLDSCISACSIYLLLEQQKGLQLNIQLKQYPL